MRARAFWALLLAAQACHQQDNPPLCGHVVDEAGAPVAAVDLAWDGGGARTDESGRFCLKKGNAMPNLFRVQGPAICPSDKLQPKGLHVPVRRRLTAKPAYQVGFGAEVTLQAELACGEKKDYAFQWEQLEGPPLLAGPWPEGRSGQSSPTLKFRTAPLTARSQRPEVLSISPGQAGWYRFRVTAQGQGASLSADVEVTAASVTSGVLSVPTDTGVYLEAGLDNPGGAWKLLTRPPGSASLVKPVATADGKAGVFLLRIDRHGAYELKEIKTGQRVVLQAGSWKDVPRDCQRPECHPAEHALWRRTLHASAMNARLSLPLSETFKGRCLACHSVGYDPGAQSEGFDDLAAQLAFVVHGELPGGAQAMPRALARLSNVHCITCHGPGRLPEHGKRPMVVRTGVCAQCHDLPPRYRLVEQWRVSRMGRSLRGPEMVEPECAGCHTAQGAVTRLRGRLVGAVEAEIAEPLSCAVCHVAHTDAPVLLRRFGTAATAGGALFEAGRGAVCFDCHQAGTRPDERAERLRLAPLASQAEIMMGTGAFGVKAVPAHIGPNLCIDCHMGHQGDGQVGGHTFRARAKGPQDEAPGDCDGDGVVEPLEREMAICLSKAEGALLAALRALPGCEGARLEVRGDRLRPNVEGVCLDRWLAPESTPLYRLAYNWTLVRRDGSKGIHNPRFVLELLRGVIGGAASLSGRPEVEN